MPEQLPCEQISPASTHPSRRSCRASRSRTSPCRSARRRCLLRGFFWGGGRGCGCRVEQLRESEGQPLSAVSCAPARVGAPRRRNNPSLTVKGGAAVLPPAKLRVRSTAERREHERRDRDRETSHLKCLAGEGARVLLLLGSRVLCGADVFCCNVPLFVGFGGVADCVCGAGEGRRARFSSFQRTSASPSRFPLSGSPICPRPPAGPFNPTDPRRAPVKETELEVPVHTTGFWLALGHARRISGGREPKNASDAPRRRRTPSEAPTHAPRRVAPLITPSSRAPLSATSGHHRQLQHPPLQSTPPASSPSSATPRPTCPPPPRPPPARPPAAPARARWPPRSAAARGPRPSAAAAARPSAPPRSAAG